MRNSKIQKPEPKDLSLQICHPSDRTLPKPRWKKSHRAGKAETQYVAFRLESTRRTGGLVPDGAGSQYWQCPGCEKIYDNRNSAFLCCKQGANRVQICIHCKQRIADCACVLKKGAKNNDQE
jgi:hypothetical protein